MKILKITLISLLIANSLFALTLMTEDYPPYNYSDRYGKPAGISVDIVKTIIKKTGDIDNITILPWARSYKYIQERKGQVLFVMTRTPQREKMFKWVGPVATNKWVLFTNSSSNISLNSLEEAKNSKYTIGTYKDDACEVFLKNKGFSNLDSQNDDNLNVKKLMKNRINLWIVGEYQGILKAKRIDKGFKLKKVLDVETTELYIAFSRDISDEIVKRWQKELDLMKKDGRYQKILDMHLK